MVEHLAGEVDAAELAVETDQFGVAGEGAGETVDDEESVNLGEGR